MADSAADKLAELLDTLWCDVSEIVTAWLLESIAAAQSGSAPPVDTQAGFTSMPPRASRFWPRPERIEFVRGVLAAGEDHQLVTLRLPQERHAELRQWCADHNFSMAAVIRGLVDQFLAAQPTRAGAGLSEAPEAL